MSLLFYKGNKCNVLKSKTAKTKMLIADARMLEVIDMLKKEGVIKYSQRFLNAIGMKKQQLRSIRMGEQSFTAEKIRLAKKAFPMINLNYILGSEKNVFITEWEPDKSEESGLPKPLPKLPKMHQN